MIRLELKTRVLRRRHCGPAPAVLGRRIEPLDACERLTYADSPTSRSEDLPSAVGVLSATGSPSQYKIRRQ